MRPCSAPDGRIVDSEATTVRLFTPRPGWTEQAPGDWWRSTVRMHLGAHWREWGRWQGGR